MQSAQRVDILVHTYRRCHLHDQNQIKSIPPEGFGPHLMLAKGPTPHQIKGRFTIKHGKMRFVLCTIVDGVTPPIGESISIVQRGEKPHYKLPTAAILVLCADVGSLTIVDLLEQSTIYHWAT